MKELELPPVRLAARIVIGGTVRNGVIYPEKVTCSYCHHEWEVTLDATVDDFICRKCNVELEI